MTYLNKLLIHQLHTPQTRRLKQLNLRLHKQVERDLRYEQTRARTRRVPDRRPDILVVKVVRGVEREQGVPEDVVEDVVDACAAGELFC